MIRLSALSTRPELVKSAVRSLELRSGNRVVVANYSPPNSRLAPTLRQRFRWKKGPTDDEEPPFPQAFRAMVGYRGNYGDSRGVIAAHHHNGRRRSGPGQGAVPIELRVLSRAEWSGRH